MMRLWVQSYARPASVAPVGAISFVAHALLIAAWVQATKPAADVPKDSMMTEVVYVPPPDRAPGPRVVQEVVHYVESTREGPGAGEGEARMMGEAKPALAAETVGKAPPQDTVVAKAAEP